MSAPTHRRHSRLDTGESEVNRYLQKEISYRHPTSSSVHLLGRKLGVESSIGCQVMDRVL